MRTRSYRAEICYLLKTNYISILFFLVVFLSLFILLVSVNKRFDHDEFEHVHSAWYIENHHIPYSDFFEHHHPLLWYLIVPFLLVLGHSVATLIALRLTMFALTLCIAFVTYLIAERATKSKEVGLFSVLLLLSAGIFVEKSVEIRPDVPQVLFGLISIYYLITFFQKRGDRHIMYSGFAASVSFLFLQKTVFLLAAYAIIFASGLLRKRVSARSVSFFAASFSLPLFFYAGYLMISGSLEDYILTNWLLNMQKLTAFSYSEALRAHLRIDVLFWVFSAISIGSVLLLYRKLDYELRTVTLIGLLQILSVLLVKHPYKQYFMFAIPLLCVVAGYILKTICDGLRLKEVYRILLILLIMSRSVNFLQELAVKTNTSDLEKIEFVIKNSRESDLIYDGDIMFNLYRPDLHYFWFSLRQYRSLDVYNRLTGGRYGDYDICKLIKSKRPRFISDHELDIEECGLEDLYVETRYNGLYIRRERQAQR